MQQVLAIPGADVAGCSSAPAGSWWSCAADHAWVLKEELRRHRDQILAAVELGLSNTKLEGPNGKIRLINHRGYGHHSAAAVIVMIYLCCSGPTITLPTERSGEPVHACT